MGGSLGRLRPRPAPRTLGPGDRPGRASDPARRVPPDLGVPPVGSSLSTSRGVQGAGPGSWQRSQRAVVAPTSPRPVEQARQLFLGVFSLASWSDAGNTERTYSRFGMSSVTLIVAPVKEKDSVHLVVQRSVQTVWSFLTDHLSSHRGKNIWAKAQEDSSHVPAKEQEDPSTRGYPGEEGAKKKENLPGTSKQSSQGWASSGIVRVLCVLKRLMSNGMWASGMRKTMPGSLDRDFYYKKSTNRPTSQPQTSKSPSSNRNAIASSYSSTLGLLPRRKVADASRFPRPAAAKGAAPRSSNDDPSSGVSKGAAPRSSKDVPSSGASKADPGAAKSADPGAAKAAAPPSSNDAPSPGVSKSADQGDAAGSTPHAAPGGTGDADRIPHLASSQCQVRAKKPSESCQQTSSSASGKGKGRKIKKINRKLPRQVQGQDDSPGQPKPKRPCETSSDLRSPKRRKIVLLLPCRRDRPLVMPPAPDTGFPVTVEFYDAEKRAAMERLNKFLMGDSTKAQSN